MDLDYLKELVDACHEEAERTNDTLESFPKLESYLDAAYNTAAVARARAERARLQSEVERLTALINTPRTDDFFEAVRIEAAHQVERWGVEHDAGKRAEDWTALLVRLLGKVVDAHWNGDRDKLLHHVITLAACALNWHRNVTGVSSAMRPGVAPRTFVRSNPDPASGLPYEVCATCGKHIRNHYGFGAKTSAEYRCDPNDTVAPGWSTAP